MTTALNGPVTYDAANRWLAGRANVATKMGSKELALSKDFPPKVRAHCFFSAKVAEARVVEKLREVSDAYTKGEIGLAEARTAVKQWLGKQPPPTQRLADDVARAKTPPAGVSEEEWLARRGIANIASTARLNLVLRQNAAIAAAVGRREFDLDPDMVEREPYYRYIATQDGRARDGHAALHNLVLPKDHPFWDTHTPPWEFGCRCTIEGCDEDEAKALGVGNAKPETGRGREGYAVVHQGRSLAITPPKSGFVFDVKEAFETCDMSRVRSIPMRQAVIERMASFARENPGCRVRCIPSAAASATIPVAGDPAAAAAFIRRQAAGFAESGKIGADKIVLGNLSREIADGIGIKAGKIALEPGTAGRYGLAHQAKGHAAELADGRFEQAIAETVFSPGVRPSVQMVGKRAYLNLWNRKTGAFTTMENVGGDRESWQIVSAHYPGDVHAELNGVMTK